MAVKYECDSLFILDSSKAARQSLREVAKRALTYQSSRLRSMGRVIHEGTLAVAKGFS